jgi:Delta3,5-Delta2,4-dienoyl-CoA isomerase
MELGNINVNVRPHPILDQQYEFIKVYQVVLPVVDMDTVSGIGSSRSDDTNDQQIEQQQLSMKSYITIVALNSPLKHNAINSKMWYEIGHVFTELNIRQDCRCILLLGIGKSFCSGIDITDPNFLLLPSSSTSTANNNISISNNQLHASISTSKVTTTNSNADITRIASSILLPKIKAMQNCFTSLEHCTIPIIGIVHGYCYGAGIDLLCCTDIRICCTHPTTRFAIKEVHMGFAPDIGTIQRLPKICPTNQSQIHELCFTGRDFTYQEAIDMGLFSSQYCKSTLNECINIAIQQICIPILQQNPIAIQNIKHSLLYSRDHTIQDGLDHIALINSYALQSNDIVIATKALLTKQQNRGRKLKSKQTTDSMIRRSNLFPDSLPHSKL